MLSNDDIVTKLFSIISEYNAEELWLEIINEYLEKGGKLSAVSSRSGWGLLHYAAENLFCDVVKMLLMRGAEVDCKAKDGWTPYLLALDASIDAAIQNNEPEIDFSVVKILIEHEADVNACSLDGVSRESLLKDYGTKAAEEYYNAVSKLIKNDA